MGLGASLEGPKASREVMEARWEAKGVRGKNKMELFPYMWWYHSSSFPTRLLPKKMVIEEFLYVRPFTILSEVL